MGVCQTLLPILSNPLTYAGIITTAILGKTLYNYSRFTFLPSSLSLLRISGAVSSVLNFLWRRNILFALALLTTFSNTINKVLENRVSGPIDLALTLGTDFYDKVVLTVKNLVESLSLFTEWISQANGFCSLVSQNELLFSAFVELWIAVAAYIFAIRIYDWIWGKGMTRDIDWPEVMLVVTVVTLVSLAVYGPQLLFQALEEGQTLLEVVQNETGVNNTVNGTLNESQK